MQCSEEESDDGAHFIVVFLKNSKRIQSKEEDRTTALIGKQRSCDFGARRVNMIRPSCCEEGKHDPSWKKSTWRGNMTRQSCRIRSDDQSKHDSTKGTL